MEPDHAKLPQLEGVLETVLYFSDAELTQSFYTDILGMRLIGKDAEGRNLFFRAGRSVFLLFNAEVTELGGSLPPHGARGPVHTCFLAPKNEYGRWKEHMVARGVEILQEVRWPRGASFYFRDPDGNLLEIADADFWPP
jgi:catechol 2,3-dioxygenase-like lactoylglutathione lyase family enzyme